MKTINISQDIVPVGEFKTRISRWLKSIREKNHALVITQNGRPAGVLLSPEEYDRLVYNQRFADSIARGLRDMEEGKTFTTAELREKLQESRKGNT